MDNYQDLIKKLAQINESASITTLDVNASSNDQQQIKTVMVGMTLSSGASVSMTAQASDFEALLDALETLFSVQSSIVEQAIEQVNVMASCGESEQPGMDPMGGMGGDMSMGSEEPADGSDVTFDLTGGEGDIDLGMEPGSEDDQLADTDVVVDNDELAPEVGDDVETDEGRYKHNYSFRNKGTGLFQSLTGQQRISKGALKAAKRRLGN